MSHPVCFFSTRPNSESSFRKCIPPPSLIATGSTFVTQSGSSNTSVGTEFLRSVRRVIMHYAVHFHFVNLSSICCFFLLCSSELMRVCAQPRRDANLLLRFVNHKKANSAYHVVKTEFPQSSTSHFRVAIWNLFLLCRSELLHVCAQSPRDANLGEQDQPGLGHQGQCVATRLIPARRRCVLFNRFDQLS